MNRLAITRVSLKGNPDKLYPAYILLDEKREFVDFQLFDECDSMIGTIIVGRVENIVPNINAAFLRVGAETKAYLPLEDVKAPIYVKRQTLRNTLSIGDEILVQVVKDAIKTKDMVVSTKLSISGKYCMLTTENTSFGVSKKITGEKHQKLVEWLNAYADRGTEYEFGCIIRTNATEATEAALQEDMEALIGLFADIKHKAPHTCGFTTMYAPQAAYIQRLKSIDLASLDGIWTDAWDICEDIKNQLPYLTDRGLLHFYQDDMVSLSTLYNIRGSLDKLIEKRVWLKSGANIIIEQLETLTVIDVNSGKNSTRSRHAILEMNKEAAVEAARQLRLRNISGMVIVDFINMNSPEEEQELFAFMRQCVRTDSIPTQVLDITRLGLMEITRKKVNKSLLEML